MMDKITGTTGWGMEPTISSDGLLSMLFESGEGFSTAFDSAMLATEPMATEESLISPESELQDGLQLMESEWNAVVMPGLTPTEGTQTATSLTTSTTSALPTAIVDTTVDVGDDIGALDGSDVLTSGDLTGDMFTQQDLEPSEWIQNTMTETSEFTQAAEQVQSSVVAASTTSKAATSSKTPAGVRSEKMDSVDNTSDMRLDDDSVTSTRGVTHAPESGEGEEEIMQEWDSSHLQLDGEFEPLAANSPFPKQVMPQSMDPRVVVEADSLDAVDNDGPSEVNGTQTKGAVSKAAEPQVAFEDEFENPADARVDLSEQRTVRVVVDQELAVEVSQDGDAVDVVVEGAQDVTDNIRDGASEIAESLEDSGMHLRDFTTRRDSSDEGRSAASGQTSSGSDATEATDPSESAPIPRGQAVNVVA